MQKQVMSINDYGRIRITLKQIMAEKKMSRNALARAINARFEVVDKWYDGHIEKIDADVLSRICYVLEYNPGDIIKYDADSSNS